MPEPKFTNDPANTANQQYFDAVLRHAIALGVLIPSEVRRLNSILEDGDAELATLLRSTLGNVAGKPPNFGTKKFKKIIERVVSSRKETLGTFKKDLKKKLSELAGIEAKFETKTLDATIPVKLNFEQVPKETLEALIKEKPFSGGRNSARNLEQWLKGLSAQDQAAIVEAIQLGVLNGESVDEIVKRIIGTKKNGFQDGVLATTRRNAETVARTAINHTTNAAREAALEANSDLIAGIKWVATLDGRTSAVCRSRDGSFAPIGNKKLPPNATPLLDPPTARPPAHPNCRSIVVAILDGEDLSNQLGERPFVRDIRTGKNRQIDFRKRAKNKVGEDAWKGMSTAQRNAEIGKIRRNWSDRTVGRVPNDTTYQQWLKTQPAAFQDQVLGKTKGALFRRGGLTLDKFVARSGQELNLKQLAKQNPEAFVRSGLSPDDFD